MANTSVIGLLRVLLTANTAEFDSAMKASSSSMKAWSKDLKQIGQQATQVGASLTQAFTVPIAGIGLAVSKMAIDFESSFAGVRKTVDASEDELAGMAQAFRNLSKEIPVNVNELNRLGEAAGALGIPKAEIVDFARVMALLGVTTNLTSDQAAEGIAKIQNIFGAAGKETDRFAATLVALGNDGASTESQILEMATRIAGAGNAIGITQGHVLAFASALSSVGIEAEMGGSAISRVFIEIASSVNEGGDAVKGFAQVSGKSVADFSKLFKEDAATAVNEFITGLGKVKQSGGDLLGTLAELGFSEIRVRDTLLRAAGAGDLLTKSLALQKTAWQENSALTEEARKRFETTEAQLTLLWNRIKDVGITIGNALLPLIKDTTAALTDLLPWVESLAKGFVALPTPIQAIVVGLAGIVAAAGPVIYIFGQLAIGASAVAAAFTAKGIAARGLSASLGILRTALSTLLGPIGLVGAAAIAATAALTGMIEARAKAKLDAETFAATEDTIALAIKRGANAFINYTEAVQYNQEWVEKRTASLKKADTSTAKVEKSTRELTRTTKASTEETKKAERAARDLSHSMDLAAKAHVQQKKDSDAAVKSLKEMEQEMLRLGAAGAFWATRGQPGNLLPLTQTIEEAIDQIRIMRGVIEMPLKGGGVVDFWDQIHASGTKASGIGQALADSFKDLPRLLQQAFTGGGGLSGALKAIGVQFADAITTPFIANLSKFQKAAVLVGVAGAGALGGAVAGGMGSQVGTIAAGLGAAAIKATAWGAAMQGAGVAGLLALGAATLGIGAAAVGVAMLIKKLGSGRDAVKKFAESFGGFDALQARLAALGEEGDKMWKKLTQGVPENDAKKAQQIIGDVAKRMAELEQAQAKFNTSLQTSLQRIKDLGGGIPEALKPYLEQLRTAGRLTQENIDLLAELESGGTVTWQALEAAAGRYGIAEDRMGQAFNQAKLHASWQQIIDDIDLFARGNVDVNGLLTDMADEISNLVNQSIKFGTDIPENMRPWIQKLIDAGLLLDDSGQKITDIGKLKFGETLQTSLEKLTAEIRQLILTLGGVPAALDDIPKKIDVDVNVNVNENVTRTRNGGDWNGTIDDLLNRPPDDIHHMASPPVSFARGSSGWRDFGTGTAAMLHGVEAVVRPGDAMPGGMAAASNLTVHQHFDFSGSYVDGERAQAQLVRKFHQVIKKGGQNRSDFNYLVRQAIAGGGR